MVSYQTAWLKYHFPEEYLCAMFNNTQQDEFGPLLEDCSVFNLQLLPPDINRSFYDFVLENGKIRYGFSGMKGIGSKNSDLFAQIEEERGKGFYSSPFQLTERMSARGEEWNITNSMLLTLCKAGAFDYYCKNREALCGMIEKGEEEDDAVRLLAPDITQNWIDETEILGTPLSSDLLGDYQDDAYYGCIPIKDLGSQKKGKLDVFGAVLSAEEKNSARGTSYFILNLRGKTGSVEIPAFGRAYEKYHSRIQRMPGTVVRITCSCQGNGKIFIESIRGMKDKKEEYGVILETEKQIFDAEKFIQKEVNGPCVLHILFRMVKNKNTGKLSPSKGRVAKPIEVTRETIENLKKCGIPVSKY